jgi:hypothetical protein
MRLDGDHLDLNEARRRGATDLQLRVVELWNDDTSWRAIAHTLGISAKSARRAWGAVNRKLRGGIEKKKDKDESMTIGNEKHCRGLPLMARGINGAISGSRPGDSAWRAERDLRPSDPSWRAIIDRPNAQTYNDQQKRRA